MLHWELLGEHNRMNALAAVAAARHAGVPVNIAIEALMQFKNVKRRMEIRGVSRGHHGIRRFRPSPHSDPDNSPGPAR